MKQYVVIIPPDEPARKKLWLLEDGLLELQSIVGGNIETVPTEREAFFLLLTKKERTNSFPGTGRQREFSPGGYGLRIT